MYPFECRVSRIAEIREPSSIQRNRGNRELEENNRMGKTRDVFKKIRDTKGTFHAKMGTIRQKRYGPNKNKV